MSIGINKLNRIIYYLYCALFFFSPVLICIKTSELFEFPKMLFVYAVAISVTGLTGIKMIIERKLPNLGRPARLLIIGTLLFLASQVIATIISSDIYTSIFGYYGRWNGGLLSTVAYTLLAWGFVININAKHARRVIVFLLASSVLVSIYAMLQALGIDKHLWDRDVVSRVFSTFGQPNWLAAFLVFVMPIAWALYVNNQTGIPKTKSSRKFTAMIYITLSILTFTALLLTKSRSGLIGFIAASAVFWSIAVWSEKPFPKALKIVVKSMLILIASFVLIFGLVQYAQRSNVAGDTSTSYDLPAANLNITPSTSLRFLIWQGGINIWHDNPVFGTGVETFAYYFPSHKPPGHNLTSEWNFIYNKAHNELINTAANTGTIGLVAYSAMIAVMLYCVLWAIKSANFKGDRLIAMGLLASFISILVTNFFGFSVVVTSLGLFLLPTIAISLTNTKADKNPRYKVDLFQITAIFMLAYTTLLLLTGVYRFWRADVLYAQAKVNTSEDPAKAIETLNQAINYKYEPIFVNELASAQANKAALAFEKSEPAIEKANMALETVDKAISDSPDNPSFYKTKASLLVRMTGIDQQYFDSAGEVYLKLTTLAPLDPDVWYKYGLYANQAGEVDKSIEILEKAIELKPNYKEPRLSLAIVYESINMPDKAAEQAQYVLSNIDESDEYAKLLLNPGGAIEHNEFNN